MLTRDHGQFKAFKPRDMRILHDAYTQACEKLGNYPATDAERERLAKMVIRIYEGGEQGPEDIAALIYRVETLRD